MNEVLQFPPGSLITLTQGEYSDFCISAQLVTLKRVDMPALAKEYRATKPGTRPWVQWADFPAWLVTSGHCAPIDTTEVYLGGAQDWAI